jgi:hypothetical protein
MVTLYSSTGLSPGTAAFQLAKMVSVAPVGSSDVQFAFTPVGADGATVATAVLKFTGADAGLEPPIVVFTTEIS